MHHCHHLEQVGGKRHGKHCRYQQVVADEEHTGNQDGKQEGEAHAHVAGAFVHFVNRPREDSKGEQRIEEHSAIIRHAEGVHKQQIEIAAQFHKTGL